MKQLMFTIYDSKAQAYLPPFFLHAEQIAMRTFGDCVNDPKHQFGLHPEDYTLWHIGSFDDSNSIVKMEKHNLNLGVGLEYVKKMTHTPQTELFPGNSEHEISDDSPVQPGAIG